MVKLGFLFISTLLVTTIVRSAVDEDLVTEMPADYPYDTQKNKFYSGYLNIENTPTKKLHYAFLESQNDPANDPLVLWFNGGPGCSSMLGLSDENGPTFFEENTKNFKVNDYSWNKVANMLYIEQPAGVGFSIAETEADYFTNDIISGQDNISALVDWFNKYPEYKNHKFYISGESYAGIYVPFLAKNVIAYNLGTESKINLIGIMVGNGVADWKVDTTPALLEFGWTHGLYSSQKKQNIDEFCDDQKATYDKTSCSATLDEFWKLFDKINIYDILKKCYKSPPEKMFLKSLDEVNNDYTNDKDYVPWNYTPWLNDNINKFVESKVKDKELQTKYKRILKEINLKDDTPGCADGKGVHAWLNRPDVQKALHVYNETKPIHFALCNDKFATTYYRGTKGSIEIYREILIPSEIKILIYSGDTDGAVPFNGTRAWIDQSNLTVDQKYRPWWIDEELVAGFVETYTEGLTFVTVKGTGHMVPQWKRPESFHMIKSFLNGEDI